ncbi:MAG: ABC transporter ATP-binding protein [Clostridiales bacterium]
MNVIAASGLKYVYQGSRQSCPALNGAQLEVRKGEFVCIIGPSGCGKSTLLNILAGLLPGYAGRVDICGKPLAGPGTDRAVVFQHYSLFPWLTALGNVSLGIRRAYRDMPKAKSLELARQYLEKVGLGGDMTKYPFELSGGMQQRVAIARALAMDSDILLLDEPFGALDAKLRTSLQQLLEELWLAENHISATIFVTHDIDEAILLADRIIFMAEGLMQKDFTVPFSRPRNHQEIACSPEAAKLRTELLSMFYQAGFTENHAAY